MWERIATRRSARKNPVLVRMDQCSCKRSAVDSNASPELNTGEPRSQLVYTFPGNWCGVPTIAGHYLVQSAGATHGLIVLDITNSAKPVEVSRLKLSDSYQPHWTAWDPTTQRVVVTSSMWPGAPLERLYLMKLDPATGALTLDDAFRDTDGKMGFSFANRQWPHGWNGSGLPHGAVFSR